MKRVPSCATESSANRVGDLVARCRALVTANTTIDLPGPGEGLAWLVSCPTCVARSVHAARESGEVWHGAGEWFVADLVTARDMAQQHNATLATSGTARTNWADDSDRRYP